MTVFKAGTQVYWWKQITRSDEFPYRAEVIAVGPKRITILVDDPENANDRFIRYVTAEKLQPVGRYFEKAPNQEPELRLPVAEWGWFTRYLEIEEDLYSSRLVDLFENGNMLSYDRVHWVDSFGMLADALSNRNRKNESWGHTEEIESDEFEQIWTAARASPLWQQQVATAEMKRWGTSPFWLNKKPRFPKRKRREG